MSKNNDIFIELLICDSTSIKPPMDAQKVLSAAERERLASIRHPHQARLFLVGRYLLRQRLADRLNEDPARIPIRIDARGKPLLERPGWYFNISHSGDLLALTIGNRGALGIDLESRRLDPPRIHRLARRYLNAAEQQWLARSPAPEQDFMRLWTVKEAVLKACGEGIANNLQRVQWQPGAGYAMLDQQAYHLYQYALPRAWLTLAVEEGTDAEPIWPTLSDLPSDLEISGPQPNLTRNP
ncbi:4'-phosphopantetheinyl transferase superfamily protein [Zobellella sp. CGMCC 1.18722]|uniref:4'-phosphopantetheinyl transferase superfamily protein n=2 Tax=Zobellella iuensis TaxID=2803811 RepID=A0ABS1QUZ1_9GAMM|nr:4'-phosphopantetheinyl transferase superfamily protein [Zobellella iuensis]